MKAKDIKYIKRKLIESYMSELRLNLIHDSFGVSNVLVHDVPTNNAILKARMREIEYIYAHENESNLKKILK